MNLTAKTPCAKACEQAWPRVRQFLSPGCDATQFYAATLAEMNGFTDISIMPKSAVVSMSNLAMVGLLPGSALKLAWYVPFKKGDGKTLQVVIGYRGYVELAFAGRFLKALHTDVILPGEEAEFWTDETGPRMIHRPAIERDDRIENIRASYCLYHTIDGGRGTMVIQGSVIKSLHSKAYKDSPWKLGHHVAMARKTAVRRAASEWPQVPSLRLALHLDELVDDLGQEQPDLTGGEGATMQAKIDLGSLPEVAT